MSDGCLTTIAVIDKPVPLDGPLFEESIYVTPSTLPKVVQRNVVIEIERAAQAIGLRHGPVHAEARIRAGQPFVIEIAPRTIGGRCSRLFGEPAGDSLEQLVLRSAVGHHPSELPEPTPSGVMMIPIPGEGLLQGVLGLEQARQVTGVTGIEISIPLGDTVVPLPEGDRYLGFIFAHAATVEEVRCALERSHEALSFDISP